MRVFCVFGARQKALPVPGTADRKVLEISGHTILGCGKFAILPFL
jgi:hypothetical protein